MISQYAYTMEMIWRLWAEQRLARQQAIVEAQLSFTPQAKKRIPSSVPGYQDTSLDIKKQDKYNDIVSVHQKSNVVWYKSFQGSTSLVIGDNGGHDILTADHIMCLEKVMLMLNLFTLVMKYYL